MSKNTEALIVNTPEDGFLRIGKSTDDRKLRHDQVQLGSGSGSSLRLFEDGGWELRSTENKKGCNLIAKGEGGLYIKSEGDFVIDAGKTFRVTAQNIVMEATGATNGDITLNATRDIMLDADNNVKAFGTKCVVSASDTLVSHSKGWNLIVGNPVFVYEKKTKLIPTSINDVVKGVLDQFLLGV
tara:strand:+ start:495 stop:1046 length:552 start_codon:yes stop_codon:yes gene_type:complete